MIPLLATLRRRYLASRIATKILAVVGVCSFLTLLLATTLALALDWRSSATRELQRLETMGEILAGSAVAPLRSDSPAGAQSILESLRNDPGIAGAALYDASGALLASYARDPDWPAPRAAPLPGEAASLRALRWSGEIRADSRLLGSIHLVADAGPRWARLGASLGVAAALTLAGVGLSLLLAQRMLRVITRPIEELANLAHRVSEERDYTLRARKRADDEIGLLVESVNFMLATVRQRDEAISETNRNLERLVAERTLSLQVAIEDAQAALRAKSEFLATMSHELRTPMNAIVGMSSILESRGLDEERARFVEVIRSSANALLNIINDVLDYSKIEAKRLDLEDRPIDLLACVEDSVDISIAQRRLSPGVIFAATLDPSLPARVHGDATRLRQILVNLLGNAFKFTERGRVWLDASLRPATAESPEWLEISVRDTGIGIPRDRLGSVFESFTQVDSSTTRKYGGTGLGLAISRKLAEAMGGRVEAESALRQGSRFTLLLPLRRVPASPPILGRALAFPGPAAATIRDLPEPLDQAIAVALQAWGIDLAQETGEGRLEFRSAVTDDPERAAQLAAAASDDAILICHGAHLEPVSRAFAGKILSLPIRVRELRAVVLARLGTGASADVPAAPPQREAPAWPALKVLLAEDNATNQKVFKHMMRSLGLAADTAANGAEAVSAVCRASYDIVFMDLGMPVMDGLRATRTIRSEGLRIQQPWIVGFTANVDLETRKEMEAAGMDDWLGKPIAVENARQAIERFVRARS